MDEALPEMEARTYQSQVQTNADGVDQSARFDFDGVDGREQLRFAKDGNRVHVHHRNSWSGDYDEEIEAPVNALLSRPCVVLWVQLCRRLNGLDVGAARTLDLTGPGLPPAVNVYPSQIRVERITNESHDEPAGRRYRIELTRPDFAAQGALTVDHEGWPIEVELTGTRTGEFEDMSQKTTAVN
jgi:hypothetical protein